MGGAEGEFYRLSDETRAAMAAKGLSEAAILADFEAFRTPSNGSDRGAAAGCRCESDHLRAAGRHGPRGDFLR